MEEPLNNTSDGSYPYCVDAQSVLKQCWHWSGWPHEGITVIAYGGVELTSYNDSSAGFLGPEGHAVCLSPTR